MSRWMWKDAVPIALMTVFSCTVPARPASKVALVNEGDRADGLATEVPLRPPLDQRVDVGGGRKLHIRCAGAGAPLVVFDSGLGQGVEAWDHVWQDVAAFTRACVYDRANHGTSDRAEVPHSNRQMARELYALLSNAGQNAPYVLVGHSMGGTNVQLFLEEQPNSVAGMVLLDSSPVPPPLHLIPSEEMAEFEKNIATLEGLDLKTLLAGLDELQASKRTLGNKPLAILVAGRTEEDDPAADSKQAQQFLLDRQRAQQPLLQLSSNAVLVVAEDSGHHVPNDAPKLVIRAIEAVVDAARRKTNLSAAAIRSSGSP